MSTQVETNDNTAALKPILNEIFDELVGYLNIHRPDFFQEYQSGMQNERDQEFAAQVPLKVLRNELRNILSQIHSFTAHENESATNPKSGPKSSSNVPAEVPFEATIPSQSQAAEERIEELENLIMLSSKSLQDLKVSHCALQEENERLQRQLRFLKLRNKALEEVQESHERERVLFRATIAGLRQKICIVHRRFVHQAQEAKNAEQRCVEYEDRLHETGATSEIWASRIKELRTLHEQLFKNLVEYEETGEPEHQTHRSAQQSGGILGLVARSLTRKLQPQYESYANQKPRKESSSSKQLERDGTEPAGKENEQNLPSDPGFPSDKGECAPLTFASTEEAEQREKNRTSEDSHRYPVPAQSQKEQSNFSGTASGEDNLRRSPRSIFGILSNLTKGPVFSRTVDIQEDNNKSWSASNAFRSLSGGLKLHPKTPRRVRMRHEELMKAFEQAMSELQKDTKALTDVVLEKQAEIERLAMELRKTAERSGTFAIPSADFGEEEVGETIRSLKFRSEDGEFEDVAIRKNETLFEWDGPVSAKS
ncbi:hypothetical protein BWQ96_09782 [Gracilariopsis chorda]|uniref:Uncharacterized protein n=1 Tax=Gracilariopsis chorda TaxID=448386 RepID=A0A2V3IEM6_9FLOR|nr:hypothetical protein BWQ96_09782 [Gracilariopsis chorda]|eukprot:PXF40501.1 hypothetical protein BWQ96_09782 [Gracilariopsis chorda]